MATAQRYILIVEDDADLRGMYRVALTLAGYATAEAGDGLEALRQIERDLPDLIVLDLGLPTISGQNVLEDLTSRADTRQIPIVVVTGSVQAVDEGSVACLLSKPVGPDKLIATVRKCLGNPLGDWRA